MTIQTGLDYIRSRSIVDCDTLDEEVAKTLGPFQDCTSNQAIAYNELCKPKHTELIQASLAKSQSIIQDFPGLTVEELAIEIAMLSLSVKIAPHITGYIHVQTNPYYSYSTQKTVQNALRLVRLLTDHITPSDYQSRICIKIPSTWEGLKACEFLEKVGVRTLATTLFTISQAVLAAEVGCTYIAPYVNQLKVHFDSDFQDPAPLLPVCAAIQEIYTTIGTKTQVLPASLTSTTEIYALAGVHHITIAPKLLEELAKQSLEDGVPVPSLFETSIRSTYEVPKEPMSFLNDESGYQIAFTREGKGASQEKLIQAINIFCDMQDKLVGLFKKNLKSTLS
ncbi:transaldolase [Aspergillus sclerotioniger CBS 115572]|uniref:Transaldolase n=1 Tax=Aspergillus sclerotioniger CBS 115572 TaxID=1450535 RepID=A0A317XDV1_9EURO|nr:transaldolase [Aspergillus sclerotioniger CBS 115572]PWY96351.1 transaldolase [Aspergillus sclerotioniger CBS 115572]